MVDEVRPAAIDNRHTVLIRPAFAREHAEIGALTVAAYRADGQLTAPCREGALRDAAARAAQAELLVAVGPGGMLLGTVTLCRADSPWAEISRAGEWEFRALAVHPDARGRGVGRALVRAVLDEALRRHGRRVTLLTKDETNAARLLFEGMGFRRLPDRDRSHDLGLIAFGMDLPLAPPGLGVRPAVRDDFAAIGALVTKVYVGEGYVGEAVIPLLNDVDRQARHTELLVAVEEGHVVGVVSLCRANNLYARLARVDEAELRLLAVEPTARGRGVGESLVRAAVERAAGIGASRLVLSTQPRMHAAHRLFARMGFCRYRDRDWYTSIGLHMLAFAYPL
ncbi:GNAT family N-acetyltransferase [Longimycelium tulufanense]|nr:GNAT family N-acetyltransferase [Longimycelium tulufanense]